MGSFEGAAGMRIIISPAKRMRTDTDTLPFRNYPVFLEEAEQLKEYLQCLTAEECRKLWNCNEKIAELNYRRVHEMDLRRALTPALIAYEGIQYQYMAPVVLEDGGWEYLQEHLRILSGFCRLRSAWELPGTCISSGAGSCLITYLKEPAGC